MKLLTVFQFRHSYEYLLTMHDGHTETWSYQSRYYDCHVIAPANFEGSFTRDGYTVHGRQDFAQVLDFIEQAGPWDAVVCYGPFNEEGWPLVKARAGNAVLCLDYGGGPICDLEGNPPVGAALFDHIFVAHETQAAYLRERGVSASKARGVPTNHFRPIPGTPKLWHVISPSTFVPGKRNALVAQYLEQYAPAKPSLFIGSFEHPAIVDMVRCGGIPLNKPSIPFRNNIQIGPRAPAAAMPLLYNAAEVCIVGSQEEAGPWVALEAMACGVPTIVMADCAWLVSEAFAALERQYGGCHVVPPDPGAIHEAVEGLLTDYATESKMARDAVIRFYDWFPMYNTIDLELKNRAGLKAAGQVLT
jgi:glycosyltransferase involved in cell wall biosynthesis